MITGILFGLLAVYNALVILEVITFKSAFHCKCSVINPVGHHFKNPLLFACGVIATAMGLLWYYSDVMKGKPFLDLFIDAAIVSAGAWQFWRWWIHTKNKRKNLIHSLSKVRVTSAGLKVVPNNVT